VSLRLRIAKTQRRSRLVQNVGDERGNVFRDGGSGGESGGFDAHELDYPRHFAIRFDDKVGDAVSIRGHELGTQAGVGQVQILCLNFRNQAFHIGGEFRNSHALALVVFLGLDVARRWSHERGSPERFGEMQPQGEATAVRHGIDEIVDQRRFRAA